MARQWVADAGGGVVRMVAGMAGRSRHCESVIVRLGGQMKKKIIVLYTSFKSGNLKSLKYLVSYHLSVLHQRALFRSPGFRLGRKVLFGSLNWNF